MKQIRLKKHSKASNAEKAIVAIASKHEDIVGSVDAAKENYDWCVRADTLLADWVRDASNILSAGILSPYGLRALNFPVAVQKKSGKGGFIITILSLDKCDAHGIFGPYRLTNNILSRVEGKGAYPSPIR